MPHCREGHMYRYTDTIREVKTRSDKPTVDGKFDSSTRWNFWRQSTQAAHMGKRWAHLYQNVDQEHIAEQYNSAAKALDSVVDSTLFYAEKQDNPATPREALDKSQAFVQSLEDNGITPIAAYLKRKLSLLEHELNEDPDGHKLEVDPEHTFRALLSCYRRDTTAIARALGINAERPSVGDEKASESPTPTSAAR